MEKYEQHGLTRVQDDILGAFGMSTDALGDPSDSVKSDSLTPEQRDVVQQLIRKGLLESRMLEDLSVEFRLTPKGKSLWRIRSREDEEDLPPDTRRVDVKHA